VCAYEPTNEFFSLLCFPPQIKRFVPFFFVPRTFFSPFFAKLSPYPIPRETHGILVFPPPGFSLFLDEILFKSVYTFSGTPPLQKTILFLLSPPGEKYSPQLVLFLSPCASGWMCMKSLGISRAPFCLERIPFILQYNANFHTNFRGLKPFFLPLFCEDPEIPPQ